MNIPLIPSDLIECSILTSYIGHVDNTPTRIKKVLRHANNLPSEETGDTVVLIRSHERNEMS